MAKRKRYQSDKRRVNMGTVVFVAIIIISIIGGYAAGFLTGRFTSGANSSGNSGGTTEAAKIFKAGEIIDYQKAGYLILPQYKGRTVSIEPTEEDLRLELQSVAEEMAMTKNHIVKKGDKVIIDFDGTLNGIPFEGGSGEDVELTVGKYEYLEDFENGLLGKEVGKTIAVNVKFPSDYGDSDLDGKTVKFTIKIKSYIPAMTDKLIADYTKNKYKTMEDYKKYLKKESRKDNEESLAETVWNEIRDDAVFEKLPKAITQATRKDMDMMYENFAAIQETTVDDLLYGLGKTRDDLQEMAEEKAQDYMMARTIACLEEITMEDASYKKFLADALEIDENEIESKTIESLEKDYKESQSGNPKDDALVEIIREFVKEQTKTK